MPGRKRGSVARARLDVRLAALWEHRLTLVTAPAGSGKTTLLNQFAERADAPTIWYRAEDADAGAPAVLARLHQACAAVLGPIPTPWTDVAEAAAALARWRGRRILFVIDDLHALEGTDAERTLEQLVGHLSSDHAVLAASRRRPRFNLSRLRVSGELLELGPDDLRFRTWEVERLFRDVYREPLAPEDLAELARRTEGWAAGLQLFHLATRGKAPAERRRVLKSLGLRTRLVREYLTQNVLDELPDRLRSFLLGTCTLGRLSAPLCDELLATTGSREILEELERTQMFTYSLDDVGWYRYHEVLRSHLEAELAERHGHRFMRAAHLRAARLLEAAGAPGDALRAYCCAEDWAAAARLLGRDGEALVDDCGPWFEGLPPAVVESDPWLLLASARRYLSAGRLQPAVDTYRRAELAFGSRAAGDACRRKRQAVLPWVDARTVARGGVDWLSLVRQATQRDPEDVMRLAANLPGPTGRFAQGIAAGLAGRAAEGGRLLLEVAEDPSASGVLSVSALTAAGALSLLNGGEPALDLDRVADATEQLDVAGLTRLARAFVAMVKGPAGRSELTALQGACLRAGDEWGSALLALLDGAVLARSGHDPSAALATAHELFRRLGADVLADCALRTRADGRRPVLPATAADRPAVAPASLRCFGGFAMAIGGTELDLAAVKPRARVALHLLALHRRHPVHRETLMCALWPDADARTATRNLHVVVSSLRHLLEPRAARGESVLLVRDADAYRLALPAGAYCDLDTFEAGLEQSRARQAVDDVAGSVLAIETALGAYAGELLPEAGPAEWVVAERERYSLAAAAACLSLAQIHRARGEWALAADSCERGIRFDRYADALWRQLIEVRELAGDRAAARRTSQAYTELLDVLDVAGRPYDDPNSSISAKEASLLPCSDR